MPMLISISRQILIYYTYLVWLYIIMSWIPGSYNTGFGRIMRSLVEPFVSIFRKVIPPIGGVLDLSPIVALLILQIATAGLRNLM